MAKTVFSDMPEEGAICLRNLGIRRCRGCVRCLTEHPLHCDIKDGFSDMFGRILGSDELDFAVHPVEGRMPADALKAVERISNILEAYTGSGGNIPLDTGGCRLRRIVFKVCGELSGGIEEEMRGFLLKGPVETVSFEYARQ